MGAKLSAHVDQVLDDSEPFQRAVKATFAQYSGRPGKSGGGEVVSGAGGPAGVDAIVGGVPDGEESCMPGVERSQLLEAARSLLKMLGESMDKRLSRVCLREATKRDCEYVIFSDQSLQKHDSSKKPLLYRDFERFQRGIVKRVAVDRGRRLLVFVAGGLLAVHMVKRTVRQVPVVGTPIVAIVNSVLPTPVLGPAVGVAGAFYVDNVDSFRKIR